MGSKLGDVSGEEKIRTAQDSVTQTRKVVMAEARDLFTGSCSADTQVHVRPFLGNKAGEFNTECTESTEKKDKIRPNDESF